MLRGENWGEAVPEGSVVPSFNGCRDSKGDDSEFWNCGIELQETPQHPCEKDFASSAE